jgi:uncharacterized protein (TIGR02284 family)
MSDIQHCINVCNSLLRGELSAVQTYDKAIAKFSGEPVVTELKRLCNEHSESVARLQHNVREMGGVPDTDSGTWGAFANTIQSAANLFGAGSAIESLQRGEEHGRRDYQDALEDEGVLPSCKAMIRDELLPRVHRHIATLERLEAMV